MSDESKVCGFLLLAIVAFLGVWLTSHGREPETALAYREKQEATKPGAALFEYERQNAVGFASFGFFTGLEKVSRSIADPILYADTYLTGRLIEDKFGFPTDNRAISWRGIKFSLMLIVVGAVFGTILIGGFFVLIPLAQSIEGEFPERLLDAAIYSAFGGFALGVGAALQASLMWFALPHILFVIACLSFIRPLVVLLELLSETPSSVILFLPYSLLGLIVGFHFASLSVHILAMFFSFVIVAAAAAFFYMLATCESSYNPFAYDESNSQEEESNEEWVCDMNGCRYLVDPEKPYILYRHGIRVNRYERRVNEIYDPYTGESLGLLRPE